MNTDGTGFHNCKECHKTESLSNHNTTDHKEGEQLEDRRSVGASSCNSGKGTDVYDDDDDDDDDDEDEAVITAVPAPDDWCQHPKHVELPTEM